MIMNTVALNFFSLTSMHLTLPMLCRHHFILFYGPQLMELILGDYFGFMSNILIIK